MVWRWIQHDAGRTHSVVLTAQGPQSPPAQLEPAVEATGGRLSALNAGDLLSRARDLRNLAVTHDLVILHTHPHDVIPVVALAERQGLPPVVLFNHADHVFWLGVGIADVVACGRDSGLLLAQGRRGIGPERCGWLPIPLVAPQRGLSSLEAKKQLGLPPDAIILLSVGSSYKYVPITGAHFVDVVMPVLQHRPNVFLLVVGPSDVGPWRSGRHQTDGRVLALGERRDLALIYEAADIYIDSFPFCSPTALLEAGSYGIPLVGYCSHPASASVLCGDAPGLSRVLLRVTNVADFRASLTRLVDAAAFRSLAGEQARKEILGIHSGQSWSALLNDLYRRAMIVPTLGALQRNEDEKSITELDVALVTFQANSGLSAGLKGSLRPLIRDFSPNATFRLRGSARAWGLDRSFAIALLTMGLFKTLRMQTRRYLTLPFRRSGQGTHSV